MSLVCFGLIINFYLKYPHKYKITKDGLFLKYRNSNKIIYWKDVKKIVELPPKSGVGPVRTIVTKDNEKNFIESVLDKDVVEKIKKEYDLFQSKQK